MKTSMEITESITKTFEKSDCKLSEDQEAVLAGCLAIWIEHTKENQHKITRLACAESIKDLIEINPCDNCGANYACEACNTKAIMNTEIAKGTG